MDAERRGVRIPAVFFFSLLLGIHLPAMARDETPVKKCAGNFGAGLTLTGGNSSTRSFNLSFEVRVDPKAQNVMKANGLYLRTSSKAGTTADKLRLNFRDDYVLSKRISLYSDLAYLRDPFRNTEYLLNPQGGLGLRILDLKGTKLSVGFGAGAVWEKNRGIEVNSRGTLNANQSFSLKLSGSSRLTQSLTMMRKTRGVMDALYHFDTALITCVVKKIDVKIQFIDDYKSKTPAPTIKNNDTTLILSFLFKF
jgi:putative salt-induced outer membrane protein YdiY